MSISLCFHYALACSDVITERTLDNPLSVGVLAGDAGLPLVVLETIPRLWPLVTQHREALDSLWPEKQETMSAQLVGLWEGIRYWRKRGVTDVFEASLTGHLVSVTALY